MDLDVNSWDIIANYLPFGNWKAFIFINKTTYSLNTYNNLNKRINPLWSYVYLHPHMFLNRNSIQALF